MALEDILGPAGATAAGSGTLGSILGPAPVKAAAPTAPKATAPATPGALPAATSTPAAASSTPATPTAPAMAQPAKTNDLMSQFLNFNKNTPLSAGLSLGTETSTPAVAGAKASKNLDDGETPLPSLSDVLNGVAIDLPAAGLNAIPGVSNFFDQAASGIDNGSVSGNFAMGMLQKLSLGLNAVKGLTGGLYTAPADTQPQNPDILDKGLTDLTEGLGAATGIGLIGKVVGGVGVVGGGIEYLTQLANKYPLTAKYLAPFIKPLVENTAGLAIHGQLDPNLAGDLKARGATLLKDIGTAPLYTALGSIKSAGVSLPTSFALGFGMAKLSGASNNDAVISGTTFAFLDAAGRSEGVRGLSAGEMQVKLQDEARAALQPYSKVKLTDKSSLADLKTAYYAAAHAVHPDVGGTADKFNGVKNAFDLLSKGASAPEAEKSVGLLSGAIKKSVAENGDLATHQAIKEQLGVQDSTAARLLLAAKTPSTDAELQAAHERALSKVTIPEGTTLPGTNPEQATKLAADEAAPLATKAASDYYTSTVKPAINEGRTVVIGGDILKDHYGSDYNDNNHPIYSQAANQLYERALKETPDNRVVFTGGGPGSGKSEILVKHLQEVGFPGIVYDSNFSNYEGAMQQIMKAREAGKSVDVYGVLPNLEKARGFTLQRADETGRAITDNTFAHGHSQFPEVVRQLLEKGVLKPDEVHLLDTRELEGLSTAKNHAKAGKYVKDPLASLNDLKYNKEELKKTYAKENYTKQENGTYEKRSAQSDAGSRAGQESGDALGEDRADSLIEESGLTPAQTEEAQADWEENYADKYGDLQDDYLKLSRELLDAKAKDKPAVENRLNKVLEQLANLEDKFTKEWAPNGKVDDFQTFKTELQRGFVNPGQMGEDIVAGAKKVAETVKAIEQARALTGDVREAIYQHENARKALRVRLTKLLESIGNALPAEGWEKLYHFDENKDEPLDEQEKKIYDNYVVPLKRALTDVVAQYREAGGVVTPDLFFMQDGEYTPRFAKDKQSALDKLLEKGKDAIKSMQNGGLLSKSLGTVGKERKFYVATDAGGKRTVVYVPTSKSDNVLKFQSGGISDLGPVQGKVTPKVPEFFDDTVMRKLNDLAAALGIVHERVATGQSKGLGTREGGVSFKNEALIKTRLSPSSTLAHELGHQIDNKYGMQEFMNEEHYDAEHKSQINKEMKALADKRFEGIDTSKGFKSYVRKGSEKMAVMFEAYVHNRELFRETAPHVYDLFRDFLSNHDELKPFLDIQPTLTYSSEVHGGQQTQGKIGRTFVDKEGKEYTIGQATTKEIETNTNVEYHKNVLANYVVAIDRATNALNATKLLERLKDEQEFGEIIKKDSPDVAPPEGWKSVGDQLPQFRGYHMELRLAEALTDLAGRQSGQLYIPVFDEINNLLTTAIVLNPVMHVPNVIAGRSVAAAAGDISPKSIENLRTAIKEVVNKGPAYLEYLEHGAPFMNLKGVTQNFAQAIFDQYSDEVTNNPADHSEIAKILGYADPRKMLEGFHKINEGITWGSNDIFFMHAMMDYRDTHGGTMEDAVREVSKRMADYRIPERILLPGKAGRAMSVLMQSRAMMFGRFHYTGVIKPWLEAARDGATGSKQDRIAGLRALAYMLIMGLAVWPYINKMWQGITGSPTSYESMPGPLRPIQVGEKLAQQGISGIPTALQSVFSPSPALRASIELGFNVDLFSRNPIYGPLPAEGMTAYGTAIVSPLASASRMTPGDFALSLFGVWTPKNVPAKTELQAMKYNELPALQTQVKKDIAAGNLAKANAEMLEFNNRAIATWNQYQQESNGTQYLKTDADKQTFLKEWGIKEPGAVAQANAAAHYGDGSLTNKSSLLDTVVTYAKAMGVSPAESFHLIFSGQSIARVTNFGLFNPDSAIIVQRATLDYTEPIKQSQEAAQGKTDQNDTLELDHVVPLEAGGTNDESNLNLITTAQNMGEQHTLENTLGNAVKAGTISQAHAREYAIRYKVGVGETLPAAMMDEFNNKYDGKPITLKEVQDAIKNGDAK